MFNFIKNLFHKPSLKSAAIVAAAGAIHALSASGVIPVSPAVIDPILVMLGVHAKAA